MSLKPPFELVNAIHVQRSDGVSVRFEGRHELVYEKNGEEIRLFIETIVDPDDLAPDGSVVELPTRDTTWQPSGKEISSEEWQEVKEGLQAAALPLRTRFEFEKFPKEFSVEQQDGRDSSGNYLYDILRNGEKVALLWHDFRADDWGLRIPSSGSELGFREVYPVEGLRKVMVTPEGHSEPFEPIPYALTERGIDIIKKELGGVAGT